MANALAAAGTVAGIVGTVLVSIGSIPPLLSWGWGHELFVHRWRRLVELCYVGWLASDKDIMQVALPRSWHKVLEKKGRIILAIRLAFPLALAFLASFLTGKIAGEEEVMPLLPFFLASFFGIILVNLFPLMLVRKFYGVEHLSVTAICVFCLKALSVGTLLIVISFILLYLSA